MLLSSKLKVLVQRLKPKRRHKRHFHVVDMAAYRFRTGEARYSYANVLVLRATTFINSHNPEPIELLFSLQSTLTGLGWLFLNPTAFGDGLHYYRVLLHLMSQQSWGFLLLALGITRGIIVCFCISSFMQARSYYLGWAARRKVCMAAVLIWSWIFFGLYQADPRAAITGSYVPMILANLLVYLKLSFIRVSLSESDSLPPSEREGDYT